MWKLIALVVMAAALIWAAQSGALLAAGQWVAGLIAAAAGVN